VKSRHLYPLAILALVIVQSCASANVEPVGTGGSTVGGGGGTGGSITIATSPTAGAINISTPDGPSVTGDLPPCPTGYIETEAGVYQCCPHPLRILSYGQTAVYGAGDGEDNTDDFQDYLNKSTNGTATMTLVTSFTSIADLNLDNYDILILQALESGSIQGSPTPWTFTQDDVNALSTWVNNGGAVLSMSGYGSNTSEVKPTNQLLAPYGISYNTDDIFGTCPNNMCYCSDSSIPFNGWQTNYTDYDKLTHDIAKVGVFHGRSLNCTGSDCQIWAKDPTAGNVGVAKVVGKGRVWSWCDEWVTYSSQWGLVAEQWDSQTQHPECNGYTAKDSYTVPQFWYDSFTWAVPGAVCLTFVVPTGVAGVIP